MTYVGPWSWLVSTTNIFPMATSPRLARLLVVVSQWIVNNDRTKGVSAKEGAEALDIQAAAVWRMNQLLKRELVRRVKRGYYRPVV
jgi:hypothetical protein